MLIQLLDIDTILSRQNHYFFALIKIEAFMDTHIVPDWK